MMTDKNHRPRNFHFATKEAPSDPRGSPPCSGLRMIHTVSSSLSDLVSTGSSPRSLTGRGTPPPSHSPGAGSRGPVGHAAIRLGAKASPLEWTWGLQTIAEKLVTGTL